jgi:hypothetical protein
MQHLLKSFVENEFVHHCRKYHDFCNNPFFARFILIIYYTCLYALVCDYLPLCVFYLGLVDFWPRSLDNLQIIYYTFFV